MSWANPPPWKPVNPFFPCRWKQFRRQVHVGHGANKGGTLPVSSSFSRPSRSPLLTRRILRVISHISPISIRGIQRFINNVHRGTFIDL